MCCTHGCVCQRSAAHCIRRDFVILHSPCLVLSHETVDICCLAQDLPTLQHCHENMRAHLIAVWTPRYACSANRKSTISSIAEDDNYSQLFLFFSILFFLKRRTQGRSPSGKSGSLPQIPDQGEDMWQLRLKIRTRPRSFEKSMKECGRPGEMSDKLLKRCLEKASPGAYTIRVVQWSTRKNQDHCLRFSLHRRVRLLIFCCD